jgi:hypothetical protein
LICLPDFRDLRFECPLLWGEEEGIRAVGTEGIAGGSFFARRAAHRSGMQIPNHKFQIPNKLQLPKFKTLGRSSRVFGIW